MRKKWGVRIVFALGFLLVAVLTGFWFMGRSLMLKMLPADKPERIVLSGNDASHKIIDGNGGWFNDGKLTELIIQSKKTKTGWECPQDVTIRNCRIRGSIRIIGLGRNGEAPLVRESSIKLGHTERAQAAAPSRILISGVEIQASRGIPLYLAPGVTRVTVEHCKFTGWSSSVGIYLDAESAKNVIRSNAFHLITGREVVAVDGSAGNRIEGNTFEKLSLGGIYLYRNCGEGGTVRHQTPHDNRIVGNRFNIGSLGFWSYGIWLGSRNGKRPYKDDDAGYDFGSSIDNRDFAETNTVTDNIFIPFNSRAIRNDGQHNEVQTVIPVSRDNPK